jgi:polar amino acid transport system permease protein
MTTAGAVQEPDRDLTRSREQLLQDLARAQTRTRLSFRAKFVLVWIFLTLFFGVMVWIGGRVDPEFIERSGPIIVRGAGITIFVCLISIVVATILAIVGAISRLSANPYINGIASLYVSLVRGTPLLVQIIFVFYGLPQLGIILPAIAAGIIALSFNYGAYMTEIFRAGIQAVPRGQREAAAALGMPERLIMRRIVLPQATRIVIPAIGNDFIAMLKDSALLSVIAVPELLWWGQRLGRSGFQPLTGVLIAAVVYWLLTMVFSFFQERLERRMARSDR